MFKQQSLVVKSKSDICQKVIHIFVSLSLVLKQAHNSLKANLKVFKNV